MILALLAIPVVSVSSTALVADIASTTDPTAALIGVPATLGGVLTGVLVIRTIRSVRSGAAHLWHAVLRAIRHAGAVLDTVSAPLLPVEPWSARPAVVPVAVGRRGPPVVSR